MKLHVVKDGLGALRPADQEATEALKKFPAGEYLTAEVRRPRNGKFHRLFFALLQVVHQNMPEKLEAQYPTIDRLLWEVKLQTGYFDQVVSLGGTSYFIPHSISFAKMDEDTFGQFFQKAIDICRKYFLPGVSEHVLRDHINAELSRYG